MLRPLAALSCLLVSCSGFAQAQPYVPSVGDTVQIWRHTFGAKDLPNGRREMIKRLIPWLSKDQVVRMTILAENRDTGEIVSVHFSDPYNSAQKHNTPWQEIMDSMKPVHALGKAPVKMVEYRMYAIEDEGVTPRPGDNIHFWWRKAKPETHTEVTGHLLKTLIPAFRKDGARTNNYFAEGESRGDILNVAITDRDNRAEKHTFVNRQVEPNLRDPLKKETFVIFSVTFENRK